MRAPATHQDEPEPERYVEQAVRAFAGATTPDQLKAARLAHAGDRSPVALAARRIGELPPAARDEAARRVSHAIAAIDAAVRARQVELIPCARPDDAAGDREAALWAHYYSTHCLHDHHDQCKGTCKHCPERCRCRCHSGSTILEGM